MHDILSGYPPEFREQLNFGFPVALEDLPAGFQIDFGDNLAIGCHVEFDFLSEVGYTFLGAQLAHLLYLGFLAGLLVGHLFSITYKMKDYLRFSIGTSLSS